jgi:hypothetical protein
MAETNIGGPRERIRVRRRAAGVSTRIGTLGSVAKSSLEGCWHLLETGFRKMRHGDPIDAYLSGQASVSRSPRCTPTFSLGCGPRQPDPSRLCLAKRRLLLTEWHTAEFVGCLAGIPGTLPVGQPRRCQGPTDNFRAIKVADHPAEMRRHS